MLIFSFAFKPETKEAVFSGNIPARQAIIILQDILISDEIRRAREAKTETAKEQAPTEVVDELDDNLMG
ncbi:hypothetical protein [Shewanella sp.]|jgi:hypothetical protein|uniref:hypothetical protein n=1 Tax=Shewanella sp. TaxID=50422 RepID=UPI003567108F